MNVSVMTGSKNFSDSSSVIKMAKNLIVVVRLCEELIEGNFEYAMDLAAENGHVEIMKLCKE